jgi:hypothetical protein
MSDYCDIEFLRETLSSTWTTLQMESIRQELATRLYNANNTSPIRCSDNNSRPSNTLFCSVTYSRVNGTSDGEENIQNQCTNLTDHEPTFLLLQNYTPLNSHSLIEIGVFDCNIPYCASNNTVLEIFRWLTREYLLPLNTSIRHFTTTTSSPTTTKTSTSRLTTKTTTISTRRSTTRTSIRRLTTTRNYASNLFGQLNIVILCFVTVLFFH